MQKAAADLLANRQKRPVGVQHPDRPGSRGCGRGAIRVAEVFSRQRVAVGGPPGATLVDDDLREPGEQAFDGHQPRQRCRAFLLDHRKRRRLLQAEFACADVAREGWSIRL